MFIWWLSVGFNVMWLLMYNSVMYEEIVVVVAFLFLKGFIQNVTYIQWDLKKSMKMFLFCFYIPFFFSTKQLGSNVSMNFGISFGMPSFCCTDSRHSSCMYFFVNFCTLQLVAKPDDPYHPDFMNVLRSMSKSEANQNFCTEGIDFWVPMYSF